MAEKVKGMDIMLEVGNEEGTTQQLGGQRSATLNRTSEAMDATNKTNNGWKEYVAGFREWSVECDGLVLESDSSYNVLEEAFFNNTPIIATMKMPSGTIYEGEVLVAEFPIEAPYDDLATYTATLTGAGELKKKTQPEV